MVDVDLRAVSSHLKVELAWAVDLFIYLFIIALQYNTHAARHTEKINIE